MILWKLGLLMLGESDSVLLVGLIEFVMKCCCLFLVCVWFVVLCVSLVVVMLMF